MSRLNAASGVLFIHWLLVAFAVFGGFLVPLNGTWMLLHMPVVIWCSAVNLAAWTCPLTTLEQWLRTRSGEPSYDGGFIDHNCSALRKVLGTTRRINIAVGLSILLWNVFVYAWIV